MAEKIRVLVVDDSPTMRSIIRSVLSADPQIEVVGMAADALEARQAIKQLDPDVITLDVEMPNMDGLEFLEKIMRLRPMPVVMVSSLTSRGAEATLAALELGAFDCVGKPALSDTKPFPNLAEIVRLAGRSRRPVTPGFDRSMRDASTDPAPADGFRPGRNLVAIGASTGGVEALMTILADYPQNCPPTLITQHMPQAFTSSFAARLNRVCAAEVAEATDGAPIRPGRVYLAPGGDRHLEVTGDTTRRCRLRQADPVNGHRPSVDVLFGSVAATCGRRAVGVILTGMGRDGAAGLLEMRRTGAATVGQDERSCVVYGMPRMAREMGAVENQMPLRRICRAILELTSSRVEGTV